MSNNSLTVCNTSIRQDADGRYFLNDLHKAAGNERKHKPANWLRLDQTKALIEEVSRFSEMSNAVNIMQGGTLQGTFVVKELVYAYAMWISAKFHLQVIRAYDALVTAKPDPLDFTQPMTLAEFEQRSQTLQTAQNALKSAKVILTGSDLAKINESLKTNRAFDIVADLIGLPASKSRQWLDSDKDQLCELYNQGLSIDQIAKKMGRTYSGVKYAIAKFLTKKAGA